MSHQDRDESGFFSRWSRRKTQALQGEATAPSGPAPALPAAASATVAGAVPALPATAAPAAPSTPAAGSAPDVAAPAPPPTLQDVEQLDAQSDYRAFVARNVDPDVRNAAFKKLFHSDPHFNVMDGLDVYIDDYNTPNPLPVAIMKTLVQARAMGLIDDELKEQEPPTTAPDSADHAQEAPAGQEREEPGCAPDQPLQAHDAHADEEPVLVEVKLVPDRASNDEPLSVEPSDAAAAAGIVVPFPRRPDSADPA